MKSKVMHFFMLTMLLSPVAAVPGDSEAQENQARGERARNRQQYEIKLTIHFLNDGRRVNRKEYSLIVQNDDGGMIRMLKKLPVEFRDGKVEFIETGVKCDVKVEMRDGVLDMEGVLHLSSMAAGQTSGAKGPVEEIQCRFEADVTPGTPTVVSRIDGLEGNTRWEIEVLAVPAGAK